MEDPEATIRNAGSLWYSLAEQMAKRQKAARMKPMSQPVLIGEEGEEKSDPEPEPVLALAD
jgi:hypothetical protein